MSSTQIRFEEGLDYGMLVSDSPEVVRQVCAQSRARPEIVIVQVDRQAARVQAQVPLSLLAEGILFPDNKGLRKMANSGGNGSLHISH